MNLVTLQNERSVESFFSCTHQKKKLLLLFLSDLPRYRATPGRWILPALPSHQPHLGRSRYSVSSSSSSEIQLKTLGMSGIMGGPQYRG